MSLGSDQAVLAEQLLRERDRAEELNMRLSKSAKELNDASLRENELRNELGQKEKELAIVKHEIKVGRRILMFVRKSKS